MKLGIPFGLSVSQAWRLYQWSQMPEAVAEADKVMAILADPDGPVPHQEVKEALASVIAGDLRERSDGN